mgnify:CR=1 FL=1
MYTYSQGYIDLKDPYHPLSRLNFNNQGLLILNGLRLTYNSVGSTLHALAACCAMRVHLPIMLPAARGLGRDPGRKAVGFGVLKVFKTAHPIIL